MVSLSAHLAFRQFSEPWKKSGTFDQMEEVLQNWPLAREPLAFWGTGGSSALQVTGGN